MDIAEGIEGRFEVFWTGMLILVREEGHDWIEFRLGASRNPVQAPNWDMIMVFEDDLIGWRYN